MTFAELPVASDWFSVTWVTEDIAMLTEPYLSGLIRANLWYVRGRERDLLVDTGNGVAPLGPVLARLQQGRRRPIVAVATHAHIDHIGGLHEFEHRLFHPAEVAAAANMEAFAPLATGGWSTELRGQIADGGYRLPSLLLKALPDADFDPVAYRIEPVTATQLVEDGDVIDLGDRRLQVVHLPGHTPGSIGLLDEAEGALFAGDTAYDGFLIDALPESDEAAYAQTMRRLLELPVETVYGGHDRPFGRDRLHALARAHLRRREG